MHKKIEAELVSLAHSILEMKNSDDINELQKKARKIYEKLSVLKFVDKHMNATSVISEEKEELHKVDNSEINYVEEEHIEVKEIVEKSEKKEIITEEKIEEIFEQKSSMVKDDIEEIPSLKISLEDEFKDAISADVATQLFENTTKQNPVIDTKIENKKRSLNDILKNNLQVGLNDRIAFVKHLFDGSQEDFNRVLSQLNSFKTENEAKNFLTKFVKPDYDWSEKEEYEKRLIDLIERKFL